MLVALSCSGCGVVLREGRPTVTSRDAIVVSEARTARCPHGPAGAGRAFREELPGAVDDAELAPFLAGFDAEARRTAVAAGIEPLLARLMRERARVRAAPTPELLEMRQELAERVSSLPLQLLSVELECACVIDVLEDALDQQDERERARELALTLASLITGAGFGLAASIWNLADDHTTTPAWHDGPLVTAIVGAVVTTALGASVLVPASREIVAVHPHNLLTPVRTGADDERLLPTFVLRMLVLPTENGEPTPREALLASWSEAWDDAVAPEDRAVAESIVYGDGGVYDSRLVALRRRLFDDLESTLESLAPHVDVLSQAIARALEEELTRTAEDDALDAPIRP